MYIPGSKCASPVSAYGKVEDQVKILIERPLGGSGKTIVVGMEELVVQVPFDITGFPVDADDVKVAGFEIVDTYFVGFPLGKNEGRKQEEEEIT
jgi:hypothetical protein